MSEDPDLAQFGPHGAFVWAFVKAARELTPDDWQRVMHTRRYFGLMTDWAEDRNRRIEALGLMAFASAAYLFANPPEPMTSEEIVALTQDEPSNRRARIDIAERRRAMGDAAMAIAAQDALTAEELAASYGPFAGVLPGWMSPLAIDRALIRDKQEKQEGQLRFDWAVITHFVVVACSTLIWLLTASEGDSADGSGFFVLLSVVGISVASWLGWRVRSWFRTRTG